jgi:hypothetical protein
MNKVLIMNTVACKDINWIGKAGKLGLKAKFYGFNFNISTATI